MCKLVLMSAYLTLIGVWVESRRGQVQELQETSLVKVILLKFHRHQFLWVSEDFPLVLEAILLDELFDVNF